MQKKKIELIGHRGYSALYPENTLLSFQKALEMGCDGIELDIRLTRDNKVVVIHDDRLERTTSGKGFVCDFVLAELKKFDAGKKEAIPSLEEVLSSFKRAKFFVEIKISPNDSDSRIEKLCEETVKLVEGEKDIFLTSFSIKVLRIVKKINHSIKTGLIFSKPLKESEKFVKFIDILCPRFNMVNAKIMAFTKQYKLDTYVWTIDTEEEFRRTIRYDVKGIVSNDPGKFRLLI